MPRGWLSPGNLGTLLLGENTTVTIDATMPNAIDVITKNASITANQIELDNVDNAISEETTLVNAASTSGMSWVDTN